MAVILRVIFRTLGSCFLYPYGSYDVPTSSESRWYDLRITVHKIIVMVIFYVGYVQMLYEPVLLNNNSIFRLFSRYGFYTVIR